MTANSPQPDALPASVKRPQSAQRILQLVMRGGALPILLIICIILFQYSNERFLSQANLINMLQQSVFLLLIALGQMLVLISGGFDLSVGANVALTSIISAKAMVWISILYPDAVYLAVAVGFLAMLGVGIFAGLANGIGVSLLKVNPFIVTLATASIFQGITLVVSQGLQVSGLPAPFVYGIGSGRVMGIPISVLIMLPAVIAVFIAVSRARYGRYLFTIGSNPKAAVVAGISVEWTLLRTYLFCAVITALAGFLLTARVSSGEPLLGGEFALKSITAAVIGGCSLRGGQGSVGGTILGVAFITVLGNGMDLMRVGSNFQMIVLGIVLVGAVLLDRARNARVAAR
jgi:ribose transport system permease protein